MQHRPRPEGLTALAGALCLLVPAVATPASSRAFEARLERGLEYHTLQSSLGLARPFWSDTLRLALDLDGRQGFQDWNRQSGRVSQSASLGWERPVGDLSWLLEGRSRYFAETFQGDRERRRTLQGDLAAGMAFRWGQARLRTLAGITADARRESTESGGLLRLGADTDGDQGPLAWQGTGSASLENLDSRRNRGAALELLANYDQSALARDEARLGLSYQREDLYLDPASSQLERRTESSLRLANTLISRPLAWSETRLETQVWRLDQTRLPLPGAAGATSSLSQPSRDSRHEDLGFDAGISQRAWWGKLEGQLRFSLVRQRQDSRYRSPGEALQTALSRIRSNRLETRLAWQPGADSLGLQASLVLHSRDTDQQRGELARDADYTDRLQLELLWGWRRIFSPRATLWVQAGLARLGEQHLQATRSAGNHENRRWLLDFRHRLRPVGPWILEGSSRTLAAYRLFQYESLEEPRSTLQRRWILEERLGSGPLHGLSRFSALKGWREELTLRAGLVLEDGGRYQRDQHLELLSDSADERTLGAQWQLSRGAWTIAPGLRWFSHRDYEWLLEEGERQRRLRRDLFRRGPELDIAYERRGVSASLTLYREVVHDGAGRDRNLWANLQLRMQW
jgi:hypothetical protein